MKILSGKNCQELSSRISKRLGVGLVARKIDRFNDQEFKIQILESLSKEDVVVIQSTSNPANDHLFELFLLVDAAKRAGASRVVAVIPYFGYARQDRSSYNYGPISASLIATLLESIGVEAVIAVDLHSKQSEGFFKIGIRNLDPTNLFISIFKNCKNYAIVSPDVGGMIRARQFSENLGACFVILDKKRDPDGKCKINNIFGDVSGKKCIIIDDIVDTAGTLCEAANCLMDFGAVSVEACVTHGVLSHSARKKIELSPIKKLYITDSISNKKLSSKFSVVSIDNLICESLTQFGR